jgi:hypothetical protein
MGSFTCLSRISLSRGLALAAWLVSTNAPAQEITPQYTSLQDCKQVSRLKLPNRVVKDGVFRCKGAGGYGVYVVEDDPRSFLVLERGKKLFSLAKPMNEEFSLGDFPNVSGAKNAEWRIAGGKALALIVRVAYQKQETGKAASTLLAFDLRGATPTLIGAAAGNEEARRLADAAPGGDEEAQSRACNAIYADLCKDFPPGPERLGHCYDKRPAIADRIPAKCVADFQTNIENYHQAVGAAK